MRFSFTRRNVIAAGSALILAAGLSATQALAGSSTGTLSVSATVASTCTISQNSALTFTGYDRASGTDNDAAGSMTIACTNGGAPSSVSFDNGSNGEGTPNASACDSATTGGAAATNRCLKSGSNYLSYQIYDDSGRSAIFPVTPSTSFSFTSTGTGALPVYGRIFKSQAVPTGSYTDTLTATVNY